MNASSAPVPPDRRRAWSEWGARVREHARRTLRIAYRGVAGLRSARGTPVPAATPVPVTVSGAADVPEGYDAFTRSWVARVLGGELEPPPCPGDPEVRHDQLRLRGVLPALAEMYRDTGSHAIGGRISALVDHTMHLADRLPGEGWDTSTAALRLVSLLRAAETLRPAGLAPSRDPERLRNWVAAHARPLAWGALSEPAGNHEVVNAAGRAALHLLLDPLAPLPPRLREDFHGRFAKQLLPDGGHVERSPHYHAQVLALATAVSRADARRGGRLEAAMQPSLGLARRALANLLDPRAPFRLGDVSRTFSGRLPAADAREGLGGHPVPGERSVSLPDFGVVVTRWATGGAEFCLVVDVGEMGHAANPGHGHADALSFCLYVNGCEVVADPGTFLYANEPDAMWFKLAEAHAGVRWPHQPSCTLSRFFRWRRTAPQPGFASHSGGPVGTVLHAVQEWRRGGHRYRHSRSWIPLPRGLAVVDRLSSSSGRVALSRLPLHPGATAVVDGRLARVAFPGGSAVLRTGGAAGPFRERTGWYAPTYGERVEAAALEWQVGAPRGPGESWTRIEVEA